MQIFQGGGVEQCLFQLEVKILCDDYTGCDEVDNNFATEAGTMIAIVCEENLAAYLFLIFTFNRNIYSIIMFKCGTIIFYLRLYIF